MEYEMNRKARNHVKPCANKAVGESLIENPYEQCVVKAKFDMKSLLL